MRWRRPRWPRPAAPAPRSGTPAALRAWMPSRACTRCAPAAGAWPAWRPVRTVAGTACGLLTGSARGEQAVNSQIDAGAAYFRPLHTRAPLAAGGAGRGAPDMRGGALPGRAGRRAGDRGRGRARRADRPAPRRRGGGRRGRRAADGAGRPRGRRLPGGRQRRWALRGSQGHGVCSSGRARARRRLSLGAHA